MYCISNMLVGLFHEFHFLLDKEATLVIDSRGKLEFWGKC